MARIDDTRFIGDNAVRDEDILLDNGDWLRGRNNANNADVNLLRADAGDRLVLGDANNSIVVGAQRATDPSSPVAGQWYYNTTDNAFRFYDGTTWAEMGGGGGVTYPLLADDGSITAPSYSFSGDPNTGMYRVGNDEIGFATNGARRLRINSIGGILPTSNNSGTIGNTSTRFASGHFNTLRVGDSANNGETSIIDSLPSVPTGSSCTGIRLNLNTSNTIFDLGIVTSNAVDFNTRSIRYETGNATGASNSSGNHIFYAGTVAGTGTRGHVDMQNSRALILPKLAAAPSSPVAGMVYYDTTTDKSYTYDGTTWQAHW